MIKRLEMISILSISSLFSGFMSLTQACCGPKSDYNFIDDFHKMCGAPNIPVCRKPKQTPIIGRKMQTSIWQNGLSETSPQSFTAKKFDSRMIFNHDHRLCF
ncbi:hypothetical protein SADUNF_Sadunf13G0013000 [Salix dunnii]|uniref:Uncharacterized protein n=1 Tax=Salix dunnii TaxID=1413687 RepID=A0A835JEU5_9ROSI|nr:hypothetical protein SADUNF_Sadunf13G0013000 [Salix dunnii]